MSESVKQRIEWIDLVRGFGILLVIFGHASIEEHFSLWLHAFHMPLFFVVSGYLYSENRKGTTLGYIGRKAKAQLLPYAVWGILTYLLWLFLYRGQEQDLLSPLLSLLWINSTGLKISGVFWFLTALFIASVLFDLILRHVKNRIVQGIILCALAIVGCLFRRVFDRQLPWSMLSAFVGMGFMYLGYQFKAHENNAVVARLNSLKWYVLLPVFAAVTVLIFLNGEVNMRRSLYQIVPLFWLNAALMVWLIFLCAKRADERIKSGFGVRILSAVKRIGRNSIVYVCLETVVLKSVEAVRRTVIPTPSNAVLTVGLYLLEALISIAILFGVDYIVEKTFLKHLFGK